MCKTRNEVTSIVLSSCFFQYIMPVTVVGEGNWSAWIKQWHVIEKLFHDWPPHIQTDKPYLLPVEEKETSAWLCIYIVCQVFYNTNTSLRKENHNKNNFKIAQKGSKHQTYRGEKEDVLLRLDIHHTFVSMYIYICVYTFTYTFKTWHNNIVAIS